MENNNAHMKELDTLLEEYYEAEGYRRSFADAVELRAETVSGTARADLLLDWDLLAEAGYIKINEAGFPVCPTGKGRRSARTRRATSNS